MATEFLPYILLALIVFLIVVILNVRAEPNQVSNGLIQALVVLIQKLEGRFDSSNEAMKILTERIAEVQKKNDELRYENIVIRSTRDAILAKYQVLEEQNRCLSESLKALGKEPPP